MMKSPLVVRKYLFLKRTSLTLVSMSANDPKRTCGRCVRSETKPLSPESGRKRCRFIGEGNSASNPAQTDLLKPG